MHHKYKGRFSIYYENKFNISNEEKLAEKIAIRWKLGWKRNPPRYPIDISFVDNKIIKGFAEIRCRTVSSNEYKTFMISISKVMAANDLAKSSGLSVLLIVQWTDCIGWINLETVKPEFLAWGGRLDRQDVQDMEPVAHYLIKHFKIIKNS